MRHLFRGVVAIHLAAAAAAGLAGCSGDTNPIRDVAVATGVGAQPRTAPDFVARSRPEKLDYLPVGVSAPPRATAARPQAAVSSVEAEMDALRAANEARAAEARAAGAAAAPPPQ